MNVRFIENNVKYLILTIAIVFILVGILREEQIEVLQKAINVCLECIGVG